MRSLLLCLPLMFAGCRDDAHSFVRPAAAATGPADARPSDATTTAPIADGGARSDAAAPTPRPAPVDAGVADALLTPRDGALPDAPARIANDGGMPL